MVTSKGEKVFNGINLLIMAGIVAAVLVPLLYLIAASFSSGAAVSAGRVGILPVEFTWSAYQKVVENELVWSGYYNTIFYTIFGTALSLVMTICGAYPLSKKRLKIRTFVSLAIAFTMWFNAGMVPFYLNLKDLGLTNNRMSILLPFAISTFNVILLRTYFQSIPDALEEAAYMDGANDFWTLFHVYLPIAKPSLITVGLFYAVSRWNGYLWSMILLREDKFMPLQVILKKQIIEVSQSLDQLAAYDSFGNYSETTVVYATIVVSVIPMILIYLVFQKYLMGSVMVGSIKG